MQIRRIAVFANAPLVATDFTAFKYLPVNFRCNQYPKDPDDVLTSAPRGPSKFLSFPSVTFMVSISAANEDPDRPLTAIAVSSGPSSRVKPTATKSNFRDGQSPRSTRKYSWQEHGHYWPVIIVGNSSTCAGEGILIRRI